MDSPKPTRLLERLDQLKNQSVLVIGDLILDEFIWGTVDRISPEAPVPVIQVKRQEYRLGGAANVAFNLAALGARPILAGVVGEDREAVLLKEQLEKSGISTECILADSGRPTSVKTRIIAHHQQVCRTDREAKLPLSDTLQGKLQAQFLTSLHSSGAVILSDYAKGIFSGVFTRELIAAGRSAGQFIAVDPKVNHFSIYKGASIITPNKREAELASGLSVSDEPSLLRAGRRLLETLEAEYLLVTRGDEGMTLFDRQTEFQIPTVAREVFDVTGAGDTVIAVLTLAVAAGASVYEAAHLANFAAGIVVGKLGTAAATAGEIRRGIEGHCFPDGGQVSSSSHEGS